METGFYKVATVLLFAPNKVENKDYILIREDKLTYTYPIHGWYWFDTLIEAETFFISEGWIKPVDPFQEEGQQDV